MIESLLAVKLLGLLSLILFYGICIGISYNLLTLTKMDEDNAELWSHLWPLTITYYLFVWVLCLSITVIRSGVRLLRRCNP